MWIVLAQAAHIACAVNANRNFAVMNGPLGVAECSEGVGIVFSSVFSICLRSIPTSVLSRWWTKFHTMQTGMVVSMASSFC